MSKKRKTSPEKYLTNDKHFLKQVCFSRYGDMEFKMDDLVEAVKLFLPKGEWVDVKRGKGVWRVKVVGHSTKRWAGYFQGESQNGKVHTFFYTDVILSDQL